MFSSTNELFAVIIYIDSLITINGSRQKYTTFLNEIDASSKVELSPEILKVIRFLKKEKKYLVVSQYCESDLKIILSKLKPQIDLRAYLAKEGDKHSPCFMDRQIKRAVFSLMTKPWNTVFFCGDPESLDAALDHQLGTICWVDQGKDRSDLLKKGPDFVVNDAQKVEDIFSLKNSGYFSETLAAPTVLRYSHPSKLHHQLVTLKNNERSGEYIFAGGRYFSKDDARYSRHALSLRIINSKEHMQIQRLFFIKLLATVIHTISRHTKTHVDFITRIPPKPGQPDRLGALIKGFTKKKPNLEPYTFSPLMIRNKILECRHNFASQKTMSFNQRRKNVQGVFKVPQNVAGNNIYVVDDIVTSGSTLKEACKVLYEAGAKNVVPVAMAYHPIKKVTAEPVNLVCKKCGGTMVAHCRNRDGVPFYGCSNFRTSNCKEAYDFHIGMEKLNSSLTIDPP